MAPLKIRTDFRQIFELAIAVGTETGGDLLVVHTQGVSHLAKQAGDSIGRDEDAETGEFFGNGDGCTPTPSQSGYRIAGGVVF